MSGYQMISGVYWCRRKGRTSSEAKCAGDEEAHAYLYFSAPQCLEVADLPERPGATLHCYRDEGHSGKHKDQYTSGLQVEWEMDWETD